ncbi:hypothetical protein B1J93_08530 [Leptospira kirschneri serovar Pomona]|uniref:Uncharacterized protein n=1 Tax=Leptospira kirschneri serovar Pomona TaxID=561005 RepID=A0A1T1DQC6_9LEPT|nr:hypothetical protein [Leptospira kirschneri]OOV43016.1 hypothetical protein B1J93_08530 [Leptospira kirschneri serovar Pomona]
METKNEHTSQTIHIKQKNLEQLLKKYNWNEISKGSKVFQHFNIPKVKITIKNDNEAHFCVKKIPYYILKDPETIEQILRHIDSTLQNNQDKQIPKSYLQVVK